MKPSLPYYLIAILLNLTTCKIDDGPQPCADTNTYHTLSAEQINQTPYFTNPLFDTVSFASNTGDTLTFTLQKIDTTWLIKDINTNPNQQCGYFHHYQNITASYKTIKGGGFFEVKKLYSSICLCEFAKATVDIKFNSFNGEYDLNLFNSKDPKEYIKEIDFGSHQYFNLLFVDNRPNYRLYLNQTHGLIRIGFNNDAVIWSLIE